MTKTNSRMKWLVLALLVAVAIGAVLLSFLSTPAKATDPETLHVFVSASSNLASVKEKAVEQGWLTQSEADTLTCSTSKANAMHVKNVWHFSNFATFISYGMASDCAGGVYKYINDAAAGTVNPELDVIVYGNLNYTGGRTDNFCGNKFTIKGQDISFYIRAPFNASGAKSTITVASMNSYLYINNSVTLDNVIVRGRAGDFTSSGNTYVFGGNSTDNGSYWYSSLNRVMVSGVDLTVKNGSAIYDSGTVNPDTGKVTNATSLSTLVNSGVKNYNGARVNSTVNRVNVTADDMGTLTLLSGSYGTVYVFDMGKYGVSTTPYSELDAGEYPTPTAEGQVSGTVYNYYDYGSTAPSGATPAADDRANWYRYDFNGGAADASVTVGGTASISTLRPTSNGDTSLGVEATAHITITGGSVSSLYLFHGDLTKTKNGSHTQNSLVQYGSVECDITGGTIGSFYGGFARSVTPVGSASAAPACGQAHTYGDLTVNFTGGTLTGTFYAVYSNDSIRGTAAYNSAVIHGTTLINIGDPLTGTGPYFNGTGSTIRTTQGSNVFGEEGDPNKFTLNFYGGDFKPQVYYAPAAYWNYTPEINFYGGNFSKICYGFSAIYFGDSYAPITETFTGESNSAKVPKITIDGATIGELYGGLGGTTNASSARTNASFYLDVKSGTIGTIFMFNDGAQVGRMGGSDSNVAKTLHWFKLGDPSYNAATKPLVIGEYYAATDWSNTEGTNAYGNNKLMVAQGVAITEAYQNVILDPEEAFETIDAVGDHIIKQVLTNPSGSGTGTRANGVFTAADFSGDFYILGSEINSTAGENSGKYPVDVVFECHGFDLESRTNDNLFGNVIMRHKLTTDYANGGIYLNIEGAADNNRLTLTKGVLAAGVDTDEGILINNIVANNDANATYTGTEGNGVESAPVVPAFYGDVKIALKYVDIGSSSVDRIIHLIQTMQLRGSVTTEIDHCTLNGSFCALSDCVAGTDSSTLSTVTTTISDSTINGNYFGGAINSKSFCNLTNSFDNVTVTGEYYGGFWNVTNGENIGINGSDGTPASRGGINFDASWIIGTTTNNLNDVSITGTYVGGNKNGRNGQSNCEGSINNVFTGTSTVGTSAVNANYYGGFNASTTVDGNITNNLTGLTIYGYLYAAGGSTAVSKVSGSGGNVFNTFTNLTVNGNAYVSNAGTTGSGRLVNGNVTTTATDCTFNGEFRGTAYGNVAGDVTGTYNRCSFVNFSGGPYATNGGSNPGFRGNVSNTLSGCTVSGYVLGGAVSTGVISGNVSTTLQSYTDPETSAVTRTTIAGNFRGGSYSGSIAGSVTNTITDATVTGEYWGGSYSGDITGGVTNTITCLVQGDSYHGGSYSGSIGDGVTNTVTRFVPAVNPTEKSFYAGSDTGDITGDITTTIDPASDTDFFVGGIIVAGSNTAMVTGDITLNLKGGVQYSSRHVLLGNRQDAGTREEPTKYVDGSVLCNVYGGNWGTFYLSSRNNSAARDMIDVTGNVTLNLYGGSIGNVRQGYTSGGSVVSGSYVGGTASVNIYTNDAAGAIPCDDLVVRGTINGVTETYQKEGATEVTPYTVNVYAGSKTLYYAGGINTNVDGTFTSTSVTSQASVAADNFEGTTLYIAPASTYKYAITCFGDTGFIPEAEATGIAAMGLTGTYDWYNEDSTYPADKVVLKGETSSALVSATAAPYSEVDYSLVDGNATWTAQDLRIKSHDATQVVLDTTFTVKILFSEAKFTRAAANSDAISVTYQVGEGEVSEPVEFTTGTGTLAGYKYFDVTGISAADYKTTEITLYITVGSLPTKTVTITGETILDDLSDMGEDEAVLASAIGEFTDALNAVWAGEAVAVPTTAAPTAEEVSTMLTARAGGKTASTSATTMGDHITAVGVNLKVTDKVTINFWFHVTKDAEITSAAINGVALDLSAEGVLTRRYNGEEATNYWTISCDVNGADMANMLTLTVNDGSTEFNACPLTYAQALAAQDANLSQVLVTYVYNVVSKCA